MDNSETDKDCVRKHQLDVDGVFIAVGTVPDTGICKRNWWNWMRTDISKPAKTEEPACRASTQQGDIRTKELRQIITAAADGANCVNSAQQDLYDTGAKGQKVDASLLAERF